MENPAKGTRSSRPLWQDLERKEDVLLFCSKFKYIYSFSLLNDLNYNKIRYFATNLWQWLLKYNKNWASMKTVASRDSKINRIKKTGNTCQFLWVFVTNNISIIY